MDTVKTALFVITSTVHTNQIQCNLNRKTHRIVNGLRGRIMRKIFEVDKKMRCKKSHCRGMNKRKIRAIEMIVF